jgi:hypothetical protein
MMGAQGVGDRAPDRRSKPSAARACHRTPRVPTFPRCAMARCFGDAASWLVVDGSISDRAVPCCAVPCRAVPCVASELTAERKLFVFELLKVETPSPSPHMPACCAAQIGCRLVLRSIARDKFSVVAVSLWCGWFLCHARTLACGIARVCACVRASGVADEHGCTLRGRVE